MKDQHEKIKGYRDLSQAEIDLMNKVKTKGEELGELVNELLQLNITHGTTIDPRWVAIGKTDLQTGIMALIRAVAQPTTF